jgi:Arc/MetJ-type ribon-helix-helix transcriptional regulator
MGALAGIVGFGGISMTMSKIAISLDESTLLRLDRLVQEGFFASRSQAIREAVIEKLVRLQKGRLARECAKLDPCFEKAGRGRFSLLILAREP